MAVGFNQNFGQPIEEELILPRADEAAVGGRSQFQTTFGTPAQQAAGVVTAEEAVGQFAGQKAVQGPASQRERVLQMRENASAIFFDVGRDIVKISKETDGPLLTREGSALRQQFDKAANTYVKAIVASGESPERAQQIVGIKKGQIEAKIPRILPEKGVLDPGQVPTKRNIITGAVEQAGAAAPFPPKAVTAGGALIGPKGPIGQAPPIPPKAPSVGAALGGIANDMLAGKTLTKEQENVLNQFKQRDLLSALLGLGGVGGLPSVSAGAQAAPAAQPSVPLVSVEEQLNVQQRAQLQQARDARDQNLSSEDAIKTKLQSLGIDPNLL